MRIPILLLVGLGIGGLAGHAGTERADENPLEISVDGQTLHTGSAAEGAELRRLISLEKENHESLNALDASGSAPLHNAAGLGRLAVVQYLLSHGARVNLQRRDLFEALTVATGQGRKAAVEYLLEHGADVTGGKTHGFNPIQYAAQDGYLDIAAILLAHGADVMSRDGGGRTALSLAVSSPAMLGFLVKHGADVNAKDNWGATPLCRAIEGGQLDGAKALLELDADPNVSYINNGNFQSREKLSHDLTPLCVATARRNLPLVELLIRFKADVNGKTGFGWTPSHFAAATGAMEMIDFLAERGADLNTRNALGATPLVTAILHRNNAAAEKLLERHANIEARDNGGRTALHQAIVWGMTSQVDLLLEHGAAANAKDAADQTPLDLLEKAAREGVGDFSKNPPEAKQKIAASLFKKGAIMPPEKAASSQPL
jgi:serine/threonine-protein phosphatase 6 regulatory ankyrin repeat subunit A/cytohesin